MDFLTLREKYNTYIAGTYKRFPLALGEGKGAKCTDLSRREYTDFSSGIGVNSLGFSNELWAEAVKGQIDKLSHISNLYYTLPQAELAEKLCKATGMKKVFFANSGAEANEGAIKAARKYSSDKYGGGRHEIITLINSFHGRTLATLAATGQEVFHKHFGPFPEGFLYSEANNIDSIKSLVSEKTAAIMVECIQGEGGVNTLNKDFLEGIYQICRKKDILLVVDEVQTGVGRTGTFLLADQYNISPDIVTLAKGLGGGLPIGAVLFGEKTEATLGFGDHGTTFGGNPIVAAGAVAVMDSITDELLKSVVHKGDYLRGQLLSIKGVQEVSGKGLMLGVTLVDKLSNIDVINIAGEKGLILLSSKHKLRLLPPLNITQQEIDKGLSILRETIEELLEELR